MQDDALATTRERMLGYEHAFAYVASAAPARRHRDDAAGRRLCAGNGAPCDYYTQGRDFEPFVLTAATA